MLSFSRRKTPPRFSVIVPTYNRSRFIVPTLESALEQTYARFEIIVIGDRCTDDTEQVVRQKFGRAIRWISFPEHSGSQSLPNNVGVQAAAGTHIAYLGHDDIWSPNHLELLAAMFKRGSPDFAVSGCIYHGPSGSRYYQFTGLFEDSGTAFREFFPPSSIAHRRDLIARTGPWRDPREIKPPVDCEFLLRAAQTGAASNPPMRLPFTNSQPAKANTGGFAVAGRRVVRSGAGDARHSWWRHRNENSTHRF